MKNNCGIGLMLFLTLAVYAVQAQTTMTSRQTGNWDASDTWISPNQTGTITTSTGSATVTGTGTSFTTELAAGYVLYRTNGAVIGTVLSITNNTTLTLTANAASTNSNANYRMGKVPASIDPVIIATGHTVTVNGTFTCASMVVGSGNGTANLTFSGGSPQLTVSGAVSVGDVAHANRRGVITFTSGSTLSVGSLTMIRGQAGGTQMIMTAGGTLQTGSLALADPSNGPPSNPVWTPGTGTVELTATNTVPNTVFTSFNNLIVNTATTTTFGAVKTINGTLSVSGIANLGTFTHSASALTLGGAGQTSGSWGSTSSTATFTNDTYFAATTGIVNVATSTCTPPTAYTVSGGGTYCNSGTLSVGLSNSDVGVSYQLQVDPNNGGSPVDIGSPQAGTGSALTFSGLSLGGTYTIVATNTSTNCTQTMSGSAVIDAQFNLELEAPASISCGDEITVKVKAGTCYVTDLASLQFSLTWNDTKFYYDNTQTTGGILSMPDIGPGMVGPPVVTTITNTLHYAWSDLTLTGVDISPGDELFTFKLKALIPSGSDVISLASLVGGDLEATQSNLNVITIPNSPTVTASVSIAPVVTLSINDITVNESVGTASFTVSITPTTPPTYCAVTFNVTTSDVTAIAGSDYTAQSSVPYTIPAGMTSVAVTVPILNDLIAEPTETFNITVSSVVNAIAGDLVGECTITDDDAYTISIADESITETDANFNHNFTATMSGVAQADVVLSFTTTNGTAGASDFTAQTAVSYTILAGQTSVTIPVQILGDNIAEAVEAFTGALTITNANGQPITILDGSTTGTITDDDAYSISIADESITETDANFNHNFTATMSGAAQADVVLSFTTTNGTAGASDFTAQTAVSYTILAGQTSVTIPVQILGDDIAEAVEAFTGALTITNDNGQPITILDGLTTGTITDDDAYTISIADESITETDANFNHNFTATMSGAAQADVVLSFTTTNGTAGASDFTAQTAVSYTILAGQTSVTIPVQILGDNIAEAVEAFTGALTITNANGQPITILDGSTTGTITDDDAYTISIADESITETDANFNHNFTATMSGAAQADVVLSFTTTNGTAGASDFTAQSAVSYTILAGQTSVTIPVQIVGDNIAEAVEAFTGALTITNDNGQPITILDGSTTGTITDDDAYTISIADESITETDANFNHNFTATMSGAAQADVVLSFTTTNGTAGATDFTAQSAVSYTILAGQTSVTIPVQILGDNIAEAVEAFTGALTITNDNGQPITILDGSTTGTITDDDAYTISIADESITETDANFNHNFTATMSGAAQADVVLSFTTTNGTAGATDFTAQTAVSYTILAGQTSVTIPVEILGDNIAEAVEAFTGALSITNANGQLITIADGSTTGTITDDDAYTISIADESITETDANFNHNFTATMSGAAQADVVLSFTTTNGSAGASDFTAQSAVSYTILAGQTSVTIPVEILGDNIAEAVEAFTGALTITNANGQPITIADGSTTGTITDDDAYTISIADESITETDVNFNHNFTATMSGAAQADVVLSFTTTNGSAGASDFTAQSAVSYTILAGQTSVTIPVEILGDNIAEAVEAFTGALTITNANGQPITIADGSTTGTITDDDAYTISIADESITETDVNFNHNFTATMSGAAQADVVLSFTTTNGTAGASDFTAQTTVSYTILAGQTTVTIPVEILGDNIAEAVEAFTGALTITNANGQPITIADGSTTGTITDDDAYTISIADESITETDANFNHNFTATMSGAAQADVVLSFTTTNGTAGASDFTAQTTVSYTILAGQTTVTIPVEILGDNIAEAVEAFTGALTITNANGQPITIADGSTTGTITDDDAYTISIADESITETDANFNHNFTATMSGAAQADVVLSFTTTNGTAGATDFTAQTAVSYTILAGQTSVTIPVEILGDNIAEAVEAFTGALTITNANGQPITIADGSTTGTITDDDAYTISIADESITETDVNFNHNFTATMSGAAQADVVLSFTTTNGTAGATDFTAQSAVSYTILAGQTSVTIPVQILGDNIAEAVEAFTGALTITNDNGQPITILDGSTTGTITDDDAYTISIADESITETDANFNHNFTATMSGAAQADVVLSFTTTNGSAGASDFTAQSAVSYTILAGQTSVTIPVEILGDNIAEAVEAFTGALTITNANGQPITIADGSTTGTITDDDAYTISIADESITETDVNFNHNFTATMSGAAQADVVLSFTTTNGTAGATDFTAQSAVSYTILAGQTSVTIPVEILGDNIAEAVEAFTGALSITNANGQPITIADGSTTGTITDDDAYTISIADESITETDANFNHNFTATMSGAAQADVVLSFTTTNGSAGASDFTAQSAVSYTILAGQTSVTIPVEILGDNIAEAVEAFTGALSITNANGQPITIADGSTTGTITDDDAYTISIADESITETDVNFNHNFTATMSGAAQADVVLSFTTTNGTAGATDFTAQSAVSYTILAGQTSVTIPVEILGDNIAEAVEAFTGALTITNANGQPITIADGSTTGTITDDDAYTISIADESITETDVNFNHNFTATMSGAAQADVVLSFTTTNGSAGASDFTAQSAVSYTILAGQTSLTIPVEILGDNIAEAVEAFTGALTITNANGQPITIADGSTTGTITDDDAYTISIADESITETDVNFNHNFTATMSGAAQADVVLSFTTTNGSAGASDFTAQSAVSYTILAGQTSVTIPVEILGDNIAEAVEAFTGALTITNANGQPITIADGSTTGTITDDDAYTISIADESITETDVNFNHNFTATMSGAAQADVVLSFTTTNGTAGATDFTAQSAVSYTILAGQTSVTIPVEILGDNIAEAVEAFTGALSITNANGQPITIADGSTTGTITDDDAYTISIADESITETDANFNHNFTATMSGAAQADVVLSFTTTNGSAGASDFTAQSAVSYTILAGQTSVTIPVEILGDNIAEAVEAFTGALTITNANGQPITIADGSTTGTITDDDAATLAINNITVNENDGTATFTVTLTGNVQNDFTVNYATVDNTALDPDDYSTTNGTLTFGGANSNMQSVIVPLTDDFVVEPTESFYVDLSGLVTNGQNVTISNTQGEATINDDDASEVTIQATAQAAEPGTDGEFTVSLSNPVSSATTITFTITGTADNGIDYNTITTSIVIPANSTSETIPVDVFDDLQVETGGETVIITLTGTSNVDVTVGAPASATVNIADDDVYTITGKLTWRGGDGTGGIGVGLANVALTGPPNDTYSTTSNGLFTLETDATGNYTITPTKHIFIPPSYTSLLNGLDAADATKIQQHLTNISIITDFFRLVAADCNKSYTISTVDAAIIRQALLLNPSALAILNNTKSWRFIPTSYTYPDPAGPYTLPNPFPETRSLTGVVADVSGQDFWGVKVGDVYEVGTIANPASKGPLPDPLVWTVQDRVLQAGETADVLFKAHNHADLAAWQFALQFDPALLRFDGVESATTALPIDAAGNFGTYGVESGELRVLWSVAQGLTLEGGAPVFRLRFTARENGVKLSDALRLDEKGMEKVAYTTDLRPAEVLLAFLDPLSTGVGEYADKLSALQNRPNPFSDQTVICFLLPDACDAQLRVFDVNGRELLRLDKSYPAGYHEEMIRLDGSTGAGVLYYELTTPFGSLSRKMVRVGK